jgi:hypothetical protein
MTDTTWLRTYNDKAILASGGIAGYSNNAFGSPYGANPQMFANYNNVTGGGISVADDGGFYDFNDGWVQFRGSTGLQVRTNNPDWGILLNMHDIDDNGLHDKTIAPDTDQWGTVGRSGNAWFRMFAYGYNTVSDERAKKNIQDLTTADLKAMMHRLDKVRSIRFLFNNETADASAQGSKEYRAMPHVGVTAQSMPQELVADEGPLLGVNLSDTVGYTIGALRGLRAETLELIETQQQRIKDLEARLAALESALTKR